jgi:serine/threonine-protein kinase
MALNHPNIVQVHDVDRDGAFVFQVMELLRGRDLRVVVRALEGRGERVPLDQAIAIVVSMCAALHHAHEARAPDGSSLGIVHRDVSPHNVFVLFDGLVKVIDFGIAKAEGRADRTATGMFKGKFGYMSPEQCLQQPLDGRSDVFNVGIVLWELTTGRRLFTGDVEYLIVKNIVEEDAPAPSSVDPAYAPALERIVMKALKRDRRARHATALALQHELEAFAREARLDLSPGALARWIQAVIAPAPGSDAQARTATATAEDAPTVPLGRVGDGTRTAAATVTAVPRSEPGQPRRARLVLWIVAAALGVGAIALFGRRGTRSDEAPAAVGEEPRAEATSEPPPSAAPLGAPEEAASAAVAVSPAEALPSASASSAEAIKPATRRAPARARPAPRVTSGDAPKKPPRDPDAPLPY